MPLPFRLSSLTLPVCWSQTCHTTLERLCSCFPFHATTMAQQPPIFWESAGRISGAHFLKPSCNTKFLFSQKSLPIPKIWRQHGVPIYAITFEFTCWNFLSIRIHTDYIRIQPNTLPDERGFLSSVKMRKNGNVASQHFHHRLPFFKGYSLRSSCCLAPTSFSSISASPSTDKPSQLIHSVLALVTLFGVAVVRVLCLTCKHGCDAFATRQIWFSSCDSVRPK